MARNLIDIPNHPSLPTVTRKAVVTQSINNYKNSCVDIFIDVFHYVDGVEVKYFPKSLKLMGDNQDSVDPTTGEKVVADETGNLPAGAMGEYDYLWYIVNVAKAYTQVELEDIYILKKIAVINEKLYA